MADSLVLCPPLCFLIKRFGKLDLKTIKNVLIDFYTPEDISGAKQQLKDDVETIVCDHGLIGLPRLPKRVDGEKKMMYEVDDIVALLTFLDERNSIQFLPKYVADSPDTMPYLRVLDGDFKILWECMTKMQAKLNSLTESVGELHATVNSSIQVRSTRDVISTVPPSQLSSLLIGRPKTTETAKAGGSERGCSMDFPPLIHSLTSWTATNQDQAIITESDSGEDNPHDDGWNTVVHKHKRPRVRSSVQEALDSSSRVPIEHGNMFSSTPGRAMAQTLNMNNYARAVASSGVQKQKQKPARKRLPMLVGTKPALSMEKVAAAKPFIGKAVYCIDNVSTLVNEDDMKTFVTRNGVTVLSCHSVKPRRSRWQRESGIFPAGRNTFRLCIPREQSGLLLKPDVWPSHITVTPWIFNKQARPPRGDQVDDEHDNLLAASSATSGTASVINPGAINNEQTHSHSDTSVLSVSADKDMEATITDYYDAN